MGLIMVNEALHCMEESVLESALDGDVGAVFGLGFPPFTGGPFRYVDYVGAAKIRGVLEDLSVKYGTRFKPCKLLNERAETGGKFYAN